MKKHLTGWLAAIAFTLFSLASPAQAQLVAGRDYVLIDPPVPVDDPAKIEVIEFFSYGCPHCSDLSPLISKWSAKLASDVAFKRSPVSFNRPQWFNLSKLYFALEVSGNLAKLDAAVFHALHEEGLNLSTDKNIAEWVAGKGVDAKKFSDAYSSFGVASRTKRADQLMALAKIEGVPSLLVDGRYLVSTQGTHEAMLALTDKIIDKVRSERSPTKPGEKKK